jgi:secreted PhoX family phosphatase
VIEALRVVGRPGVLTQNWAEAGIRLGQQLAVEWLRIPDPDPDTDEERDPTDERAARPEERKARTAPTSTRAQGFGMGAAQFARTEGITFHRGSVYFCCTNGGPAKLGQVFRLDLERQQLSLVVEPNDLSLLDGPDNICVAPSGDLFVCEDGEGEDRVMGVTRDGRLYTLARCAAEGYEEFAGATFSPDGRTLFVNMQRPGLTFAIWGPWSSRRA